MTGVADVLAVIVDLSAEVPLTLAQRRELQIYVSQYAAELGRDLGLPVDVTARIIVAGQVDELPNQFRLLVNEKVCRSRRWPRVPLAELPVREIACVISEALHYCRLSLLTPSLAASVARQWQVQESNGEYRNGWSAEGFREYLAQFVRRNFTIKRGRTFAESTHRGAATATAAQLCFEEAVELANDLKFGIALRFGSAPLAESTELTKALAQRARWIAVDPGVALPEITVETHVSLLADDFSIQVNDVWLPAWRALPLDCKIALSSKADLSKAGIESQLIVDPIAAAICPVVKDLPEMEEKCRASNLKLWDQSSEVYIGLSVASVQKLHAGSLLAAPIVQFLLDRLKNDSPGLVQRVQSRLETMDTEKTGQLSTLRWTITAILRKLLDEQVTIRDLRAVLESLLFLRELYDGEKRTRVVYFRTPSSQAMVADGKQLPELTIDELSQCARFAVRSLALRYTEPVEGGVALFPLFFAPRIEQRLLEAATRPLDTQELGRLQQAVFDHVSPLGPDNEICILVSPLIRLKTRELLSAEFPTVGILALLELPANLKGIAAASVIDWPADSATPERGAAHASGNP